MLHNVKTKFTNIFVRKKLINLCYSKRIMDWSSRQVTKMMRLVVLSQILVF